MLDRYWKQLFGHHMDFPAHSCKLKITVLYRWSPWCDGYIGKKYDYVLVSSYIIVDCKKKKKNKRLLAQIWIFFSGISHVIVIIFRHLQCANRRHMVNNTHSCAFFFSRHGFLIFRWKQRPSCKHNRKWNLNFE
jgi:hypothetical protein